MDWLVGRASAMSTKWLDNAVLYHGKCYLQNLHSTETSIKVMQVFLVPCLPCR
jgi:hypothetical protein